MNKRLLSIPAAALILTACGTAAASTTRGAGPVSAGAASAGSVEVRPVQNAGTDVQGDLDINRINRPPVKPGTGTSSRSANAPTTNAPPTSNTVIQDRCGAGVGSGAPGNRAGSNGKGPQLPACMPE